MGDNREMSLVRSAKKVEMQFNASLLFYVSKTRAKNAPLKEEGVGKREGAFAFSFFVFLPPDLRKVRL